MDNSCRIPDRFSIRTRVIAFAFTLIASFGWPGLAAAEVSSETLKSISTPDSLETRLGSLDFKDGAPSAATVAKVYDRLDYVRGIDAFMNSFSGASAYAIREGFHSIGAEDNTVVIFSELMDSNSLFLTANADTIYTLAVLDLTKGPLVVEVPPMALGTLNDMWFGWIIDIGGPGPDRGEGGKYLTCAIPDLLLPSHITHPRPGRARRHAPARGGHSSP